MPTTKEGAITDAIVINAETREITVPDSERIFGVAGERKVEKKHIRIEGRLVDGLDLAVGFAWRVCTENAAKKPNADLIDSIVADASGIEFDWLVGAGPMAYKGDLKFAICAKMVNADGTILHEWHSRIGVGKVYEGLEASPEEVGGYDLAAYIQQTAAEVKQAARDAAGSASASASSATNAAQSARNAEESATTAGEYATAAEHSAENAESAVSAVKSAGAAAIENISKIEDATLQEMQEIQTDVTSKQEAANNAASTAEQARDEAQAAQKASADSATEAKTAQQKAQDSADAAAESAASAKSYADAAAGAQGGSGGGRTYYYQFTNTAAFTVGTAQVPAIAIDFAATEDTSAMFLAQILLEAEPEEDAPLTLSVHYYVNNVEIQNFTPQQRLQAGAHTLALFYPFASVEANVVKRWSVRLACTGGTVRVAPYGIKATVTGQAMAGELPWNGTLTQDTTITPFALQQRAKVKMMPLLDSVTAETYTPVGTTLTDNLPAITLTGRQAVRLQSIQETDPAINFENS